MNARSSGVGVGIGVVLGTVLGIVLLENVALGAVVGILAGRSGSGRERG